MKIKKYLGFYGDLPKDIYFIFLSKIINSIGNFVLPFLSLFLTDKLNFSEVDAGRFIMAAAVFYALGSFAGGKACDVISRKKALVLFQSISVILIIPCGFLKDSHIIPYILILASFFTGGSIPIHTAIVTDIIPKEKRKAAFSFLYLGNNIGFAIGPMIAGLLYEKHSTWLFLGDAMTTIIAIILILIFVGESSPHNNIKYSKINNDKSINDKKESLIKAIKRRPVIITFSIIMAVYSFVYGQYVFSLPIYIKQIFTDYGAKYYGMLMMINGITVIVFTPLITKLTVKIKVAPAIFLGGMQFAIGFGMIYFIKSIYLFIISTFLWTIGEILVTTNQNVYIANNTPVFHRGRFNAVFVVISGLGYALGPFATGIIISKVGIYSVWPLCFILSLAASLFMLSLDMKEKNIES